MPLGKSTALFFSVFFPEMEWWCGFSIGFSISSPFRILWCSPTVWCVCWPRRPSADCPASRRDPSRRPSQPQGIRKRIEDDHQSRLWGGGKKRLVHQLKVGFVSGGKEIGFIHSYTSRKMFFHFVRRIFTTGLSCVVGDSHRSPLLVVDWSANFDTDSTSLPASFCALMVLKNTKTLKYLPRGPVEEVRRKICIVSVVRSGTWIKQTIPIKGNPL